MRSTQEHLFEVIPTLSPAAQSELYAYMEYLLWKYSVVEKPLEDQTYANPPMEIVDSTLIDDTDYRKFQEQQSRGEEPAPAPKKKPWDNLSSKLFS